MSGILAAINLMAYGFLVGVAVGFILCFRFVRWLER